MAISFARHARLTSIFSPPRKDLELQPPINLHVLRKSSAALLLNSAIARDCRGEAELGVVTARACQTMLLGRELNPKPRFILLGGRIVGRGNALRLLVKRERISVAADGGEKLSPVSVQIPEEAVEELSTRQLLWRAAKLPIYSVAIVLLSVGGAAAFWQSGAFNASRYWLMFWSSILIITWLNLSNDAYDWETGVDRSKRESVVNITGSQKGVLRAALACLLLGFTGLVVGASRASDMRVAVLLAVAIGCGYIYQCPPFWLSYKGLGEPLFFLAFGPLATTAFYLSQAQPSATVGLPVTLSILGASVLVGIITSLILFCSHFHQIEGDTLAGKISPLVRIGTENGSKVVQTAVTALYLLVAILAAVKAVPRSCAIFSLMTLGSWYWISSRRTICRGRKPCEGKWSRFSSAVCATAAAQSMATTSRTQRIFESIPKGAEAGGAGGTSSYEALQRADMQWEELRNSGTGTGTGPGLAPEVVRRLHGQSSPARASSAPTDLYDVIVCGGTLGVFIATTLVLRGWKVAIVEKGKLQGRKQEWNVSRKEIMELVKMSLLNAEEVEEVISIEFNPNRVGFGGGSEVWVKDILNLGVSPAKLIAKVKQRFLDAGGTILEGIGLSKVDVFDDEAVVFLDNEQSIRSRLILDVMGNASPIVRQVRWGQRPDGICLVVGSCARGFENNSSSDVMFTTTPVTQIGKSKAQYFWEAFPAGSGSKDRTTYLFTYVDATPSRPSLEELMEKYWDLMPTYQGVKLEDLVFLQVLHGIFPTYRKSPLPSSFDRVLQVGDASGIQSPLSFGGFGSITRHLQRLTDGLVDALEGNILDSKSLSLLNPYMPNLSGAWLLQRAMSVPTGGNPPPEFINELLATNFKCMEKLGDPVMRPFLQDVVQFGPLAQTMGSMVVSNPRILPDILKQVGVVPIIDWIIHFIGLGSYTFLAVVVAPRLRTLVDGLDKQHQFVWKRRFDAWKFGSGLDYSD